MISDYPLIPGLAITAESVTLLFSALFWSISGAVFLANAAIHDIAKKQVNFNSWWNIGGPFALLGIWLLAFWISVGLIKLAFLLLDFLALSFGG